MTLDLSHLSAPTRELAFQDAKTRSSLGVDSLTSTLPSSDRALPSRPPLAVARVLYFTSTGMWNSFIHQRQE